MSDEALKEEGLTEEEGAEGEEEADEESMPLMKPRELAGAINRAKTVCVWVEWGDAPDAACYLQVKKENVRVLVEEARDLDCLIAAGWEDEKEGGTLLIGPCEPGEEEDPGEEEEPSEEGS